MDEAWCTVEPWGQNSLALNYISQHDRNRSRVELLFHFGFGLGVKVPCGTTLLLCYVLFPSHRHTHTYIPCQNTQLKNHFITSLKNCFTFLTCFKCMWVNVRAVTEYYLRKNIFTWVMYNIFIWENTYTIWRCNQAYNEWWWSHHVSMYTYIYKVKSSAC